MNRPRNRRGLSSIRSSHLTLATPYQPGTIRRTGKPWSRDRSAPFTRSAISSAPTSATSGASVDRATSPSYAGERGTGRPFTIGGDNGLRGYPLRYQSGTARALFTVEERFYSNWQPLKLFDVGAAAFVDGEEKTFLDRYSDFIWWGLMGLSAMGSAGAWFAGYLKKDERNTIVGAPHVKPEHFPVFDCAIGDRAIHYMGHVKMMGAVQPFISGAISKTVNLPEETTVDEVSDLLLDAWKLGVKAIAIYRDNCKVAQPLSGKGAEAATPPVPLTQRRRLPEDRTEVGRKFQVGEYEGYIHVGLYDDGSPGDIFVDIAKDGTLQGPNLELLRNVCAATDRPVVASGGVSSLDDLRATVGLLRQTGDPESGDPAAPAEPAPGLSRLPTLLESFRRAGLDVSVHQDGTARPLPPGADLTAYRIVQEALTNVTKHAGTGSARVHLAWSRDRVTVTVADDGRGGRTPPTAATGPGAGTTTDRPPGYGLIGMRERATAIGGRLSAGRRPEGGFLVRAQLPLPPAKDTTRTTDGATTIEGRMPDTAKDDGSTGEREAGGAP